MVDYKKRLVEVNEILNHLSKNDYNKIPEDLIKDIRDNMDTEYIWKFDESKPFKEQNINRDTIVFLTYINMEYLLNEEQKEYMKKIYQSNEEKRIHLNKEKYDYDNLFNNNNVEQAEQIEQTENIKVEETALIEYKENLFTKIINIIKNFFKK